MTFPITSLLLSALVSLFGCQSSTTTPPIEWTSQDIDTTTTLQNIAFGSCNKQYKPQPLWEPILQNQPDLWIWLGDNIYGDTENMEKLSAKYQLQYSNKGYQQLRENCQIIGIWDDHDYGVNDGGKEYPQRQASQQLLADFMGYTEDHPIRSQEGAYQSYTFGQGDQQVMIILLDSRYFRDQVAQENSQYVPNETGTILGQQQWQWLAQELENSKAAVHIIGNGIQFIPKEHRFEKWANFPKERQRLFDLLNRLEVPNPILLSGDRHAAEISRYPLTTDQFIYEVTASGMTHHSSPGGSIEPNQYRVGAKRVKALNFGLIQFDWSIRQAKLELRGKNNIIHQSESIAL